MLTTLFLFSISLITNAGINKYCLTMREQKGYGALTNETVLIIRSITTDTDVAIIFHPRGPLTDPDYGPRFSTLGQTKISLAALDNIVYEYYQWRKQQGLDVPTKPNKINN